jgi:adenylate kinase family enzyme
MRIAILGNSGSGKSTVARSLAARFGATLLDLDTVAWEPGQIAVARSPLSAQADVRAFCAGHERWVVEGCYASLVNVALEFIPQLLFLNPGEQQCLENCRARPWERHKYAKTRVAIAMRPRSVAAKLAAPQSREPGRWCPSTKC